MKFFTIYILLFFSLINVQAQNQRFKNFSLKEGLSQSTVNCIIQDNVGLIWIGTQDGLNRFDGHEFIHYKKQALDSNSLPDNYVQALCQDSKGNIWIGTYGSGLAIYNPTTNHFTRFNISNSSLTDDVVMCFKEFNGEMFIGTKRGGLNKYNYTTSKISPVTIEQSNDVQIRDFEIFNNTLYVASSLGGVYYLDKSVWVKLLDNIQIQEIQKIEDELWLGSVDGVVFHQKDNSLKFNRLNVSGIDGAGVWGVIKDKTGNLWVGTFGKGLFKYTPNHHVNNYTSRKEDLNSLSHDVILSIFRDKNGGVWIGTLGGGINYFEPDNQKFKHYNEVLGLSNNVVMSFVEEEGKVYVGTYGGGLNLLNENKSIITKIHEVKAEIIRCIYKDIDGTLWIGTYGNGLIHFNPKTKTTKQVLNKIVDDVWAIVPGKNNDLWLGTWGNGLININKSSLVFKQYTNNNSSTSISDNTVISLAIDKTGNLWIGTYGRGLNYLDAKSGEIKQFGFEGKNKNSTNNKKIRSILIDKNDDLWIGTDGGGLNHYSAKNKEFNYITTENNLPNNVIYGVVEDEQNNIWVTSNYGLSNYVKSTSEVVNYDYDDGLQNNEFNQGALYKGKTKIYAGGINGFNVFDVKQLNNSVAQSSTIITSMKVMGDEHNPPIRFLNTIQLPYTSNFLAFQFADLDYSGKITYRCMLEGLDKDWTYLNHRNFINYTSLEPGKYTLKYQGKRMGEWDKNFSTLEIIIPPPFWKTTWFYLLLGIVTIVSLYLFYVLKQKKLKQKNALLESQVKIRTKEIEHQKNLVEAKHAEIQSSIKYAKRIQSAILPSLEEVKKHLKESFIFYRPKDIVAGDFYWFEEKGDKLLIAAADCTGHGVPGAMVSVVCNNGLNRSVREYGLVDPGQILDKTREIVLKEFEKSEDELRDGMDIALCMLENKTLSYAGAYNSLYVIRKDATEIEEIKANKQPIGRYSSLKPFDTHKVQLNTGDSFYIFSDGFYDQFGGENGKKFKSPNFKNLLLSLQKFSMDEQRIRLEEAFEQWRGSLEQVDDVCIIGVKL